MLTNSATLSNNSETQIKRGLTSPLSQRDPRAERRRTLPTTSPRTAGQVPAPRRPLVAVVCGHLRVVFCVQLFCVLLLLIQPTALEASLDLTLDAYCARFLRVQPAITREGALDPAEPSVRRHPAAANTMSCAP